MLRLQRNVSRLSYPSTYRSEYECLSSFSQKLKMEISTQVIAWNSFGCPPSACLYSEKLSGWKFWNSTLHHCIEGALSSESKLSYNPFPARGLHYCTPGIELNLDVQTLPSLVSDIQSSGWNLNKTFTFTSPLFR